MAMQHALTKNDYAWSRTLVAYVHGVPEEDWGRPVYVALTKGADKNLAALTKSNAYKTPGAEFSEIDVTADEKLNKCFFVGMVLPSRLGEMKNMKEDAKSNTKAQDSPTSNLEPPKARSRKTSQSGTPKKRGMCIRDIEGQEVFSKSEEALKVVVKAAGTNAMLYAMIRKHDQDSDQPCTAAIVDGDDVFFFSKFHSHDANNLNARKSENTRLLKELMQTNSAGTSGKQKLARSYDPTKWDLIEPKQSLAADILSHFLTYQQCGNKESAEAVRHAISKIDKDGAPARVVQKFCDGLEALSMAEAEALQEWFQKTFRDLESKDIQGAELCEMSASLSKAQISIEIRLLRPTVVMWVDETRHLREVAADDLVSDTEKMEVDQEDGSNHDDVTKSAEEKDKAKLAHIRDVVVYVRSLCGPTMSTLPGSVGTVNETSFAAFLTADVERLNDMIAHVDEQIAQMKASQGFAPVSQNIPQLLQTFASKPDVDSAKLYTTNLFGVLLTQLDALALGPMRAKLVQLRNERAEMATLISVNETTDGADDEQ